ncbi:MAG: S1 RNA-binding domain-containing protein [Finegoldia sp.]|nr:S1 RNA-binding domain-containing protein [Finegoldia sp.]
MSVSVGDIVEGKVTGITKFGAFVEIEPGTSGLVHISQISNQYVDKVENFLEVDQEVKCKILSNEDGKISLSIKECLEKPVEKPVEYQNFNSSNNESTSSEFDEIMAKFLKQSNERLDSIRQRNNKRNKKKRRY